MTENVLCAIIGIAGTVLGTIIGWMLSEISKHGKIKFFVVKWEYSFKYNDGYGGETLSNSKDEAQSFGYSLLVDIYNSRGDTS